MRILRNGLGVLALTLALFMVVTAQDKPWFDMEKCGFCKNLMAEKGLMDHITKWEHHNVKNGSMTITVIDPEYVEAYKRAMANMEKVGAMMQQGEEVYTCGFCDAYGALMMKGAQWDVVESGNIFISTAYSSDPELVNEIHAMTDRTNKEMTALQAKGEKEEMKKAKLEGKEKQTEKK